MLLNGTQTRDALKDALAERFSRLSNVSYVPHVVIISIGDDEASSIYVRTKKTFGESVGATVTVRKFASSTSEDEIAQTIQTLNEDKSVHGVIIQSPVPSHLSFAKLTNMVAPQKDVDGLRADSPFIPATARGIVTLLRHYHIAIKGKHALVIGRSHLVGRPTAKLLLECDATVTIAHSLTHDLAHLAQSADIIVVAIGRPQFIGKDFVKAGQIVIDVGIHTVEGKTVGDVNREEVEPVVSALSPVPGGVGPMTVFSLFENLADAAEKSKAQDVL